MAVLQTREAQFIFARKAAKPQSVFELSKSLSGLAALRDHISALRAGVAV